MNLNRVKKLYSSGGKDIGEIRSTGGITVLYGVHEKGMHYRTNGKPVLKYYDPIVLSKNLRVTRAGNTADSETLGKLQERYLDNDSGRALEFIDWCGNRVRYVPELDQWMVFVNGRWILDSGKHKRVIKLLREFADEKAAQARLLMKDAGTQAAREIEQSARLYGQRRAMENILALASSDPRIAVSVNRLDSDPLLIGVQNGVVDLRVGMLLGESSSHYVTRSAGVLWDFSAPCPTWERFVREVFPDPELARFVQKALGYLLRPFLCIKGHIKLVSELLRC